MNTFSQMVFRLVSLGIKKEKAIKSVCSAYGISYKALVKACGE